MSWVPFISGAVELGKEWFSGKRQISKAEADLKVAELKAKIDIAKDAAGLELERLKQTGTLDRLALEGNNKSLFDEAFALLIMSPLALSIYGAVKGTAPEYWGYIIMQTLHYQPAWYLGMLFLLFVNYFGFRSLLRLAIKGWMEKPGMFAGIFKGGKKDADKSN